MLHHAANAIVGLCSGAGLPQPAPLLQSDTCETPRTETPQTARTWDDADRWEAASPGSASSSGVPPARVLTTSVAAQGHTIAEVVSTAIALRLMPLPPSVVDFDAMQDALAPRAVGVFSARGLEGEARFRLEYVGDAPWRVRRIDDDSAAQMLSDVTLRPDCALTIRASPQQGPSLTAHHVLGLTLTPPLPQEVDWEVCFYGASSQGPFVHAQGANGGPTTTLALDNTEVRWSNTPGMERWGFDEALKNETRHASARQRAALIPKERRPALLPSRAAPAVAFESLI